jgi:S1-C subfamily serine protease
MILAIFNRIRARSVPQVEWKLLGRYERSGDIRVALDSITLLQPSVDDLRVVQSSYLSHYEDVSNPLKGVLKTQLAIQKIEVESAESALRFAISMYNISPTSYGLANVSSARTRYNLAVDQYNWLVTQYNATSSTLTRPVYFPYTFREGTVRNGWRTAGSVEVGGLKTNFSVREVDEDFVRLGSREDDREVRYRRQDLLDIPTGVERLIVQLRKVTETIGEKIAEAAGRLKVDTRVELADSERVLLSAALHPFGGATTGRDDIGAPQWGRSALARLRMPALSEVLAPQVDLGKPRRRVRGGGPREIFEDASPLVAMIFGKGRSASVGSGALISGDGLIVTASHVLGGDAFEVTFPGSGNSRRYVAELVFVNDRQDVALIRAVGLRSDRWLELALEDRVASGEPIVAIGNPTLGEEGVVTNAVSRGIVAKPYDSGAPDNLNSLVADVTVASGSSGGPLIAQSTGRVVGIVTAVVSPKISEEFASSGYWVLAAPSTELPRWLGLRYRP